jgi:hypothetical protein
MDIDDQDLLFPALPPGLTWTGLDGTKALGKLIPCSCELAAGNHHKCEYCGAHMPHGSKYCDASDCLRVGKELDRNKA